MDAATHRMPILAEAGIRLFFNGPESFTPDDRYLLGESPDVPGMFVAAGFNSIGIQSAGGAGKVLADWIVDGHPPMDLWDVDVRRMMPFQRNRSLPPRSHRRGPRAALRDALAIPPARDRARRPPLARSRPAWQPAVHASGKPPDGSAPTGSPPTESTAEYEYSYGRQNWFDHSAAEHHAVRNAVGLFDQIVVRQVPPRRPRRRAGPQQHLRQRRRRRRSARSSTPSGSTTTAASKPTSPSPARPRTAT